MDRDMYQSKKAPRGRALLGAISIVLTPISTASDSLSAGLDAYEQGRYEQAFSYLQGSAQSGNLEAQYLVGVMYRTGQGVQSDEHESFEWCRRAAEKGLLEAQFQLGLMYLQGDGVTQDDDEAMRWLETAARRDHPRANQILSFVLSADSSLDC